MSKLGTIADFTDLLDSLVQIDSQERESKERIAMEQIRQDHADRRQDKQIEKSQQFNITLTNRQTQDKYDDADLTKDDMGLLRPISGAVTRAEKSKLETSLQTIVGGPVDFDSDSYRIWKGDTQ